MQKAADMATAITAPIVDAGPTDEASSNSTATSAIEDHPDGAEIRRQVRLPVSDLLVSHAVTLISLQGGVLLLRRKPSHRQTPTTVLWWTRESPRLDQSHSRFPEDAPI